MSINSTTSIAVIMPCYNSEATLHRSITSVVSQQGWSELILINDASTDNTLEILNKIKEQLLPQIASHQSIQVINLAQNSGAAMARNIGSMHANSHVLAFLDADDEHASGFYNFAQKIFSDLPSISALRVGTEFRGFPEQFQTTEFSQKRTILLNTFVPNMMVRKSCFNLLGGFPTHPIFRRDGGEDGVFSYVMQQLFSIATYYEYNYLIHHWHPNVHAQKFLQVNLEKKNTAEVVEVSWQIINQKLAEFELLKQRWQIAEKGFLPILIEQTAPLTV